MQRKLWLLSLVASMLFSVNPVLADDGFYVIVGGGGVGKPIPSLPYTIEQSGFYYLKSNLSTTGTGNAITIDTSEVTLDLMGFSLTGPSAASGEGIHINHRVNVEVRNGFVKNFNKGISHEDIAVGMNHRFTNLKFSGCSTGITSWALGTIITGCQAVQNSTGIACVTNGFIIDRNIARGNTTAGFSIGGTGVVTNNVAHGNGTGFTLPAATRVLVDRNASFGNTTANWSGLSGCTTGLNTP
jgi:hypothetical protein